MPADINNHETGFGRMKLFNCGSCTVGSWYGEDRFLSGCGNSFVPGFKGDGTQFGFTSFFFRKKTHSRFNAMFAFFKGTGE